VSYRRCLFPRAAFAQREEAVAGKPIEGDDVLVCSRLGCNVSHSLPLPEFSFV
jgi:hypothetical protein